MYPLEIVSKKIIECYEDMAKFVDMPEVIIVLSLVALLISLGLLRLSR